MMLEIEVVINSFLFKHILFDLANVGNNLPNLYCEFSQHILHKVERIIKENTERNLGVEGLIGISQTLE